MCTYAWIHPCIGEQAHLLNGFHICLTSYNRSSLKFDLQINVNTRTLNFSTKLFKQTKNNKFMILQGQPTQFVFIISSLKIGMGGYVFFFVFNIILFFLELGPPAMCQCSLLKVPIKTV